ncbi:MAG TPA: hypothetical protein VFJ85_18805 [Acidimicrobiales bacterium]|nr:hypothetical protein [Acidimicrobiales bacterium]
MSVDVMVKDAVETVPKAVAAGIVDMASGMLLGVKTVDSHPQQILDLVSAATKELFEGEMVTSIENVFKRTRGVNSDEHYFQELIVSSTNLWHYFGRLKAYPSVVLVVVCRGDVNVGMLLMKCREICTNGTI